VVVCVVLDVVVVVCVDVVVVVSVVVLTVVVVVVHSPSLAQLEAFTVLASPSVVPRSLNPRHRSSPFAVVQKYSPRQAGSSKHAALHRARVVVGQSRNNSPSMFVPVVNRKASSQLDSLALQLLMPVKISSN
jgi:hypothetical protein